MVLQVSTTVIHAYMDVLDCFMSLDAARAPRPGVRDEVQVVFGGVARSPRARSPFRGTKRDEVRYRLPY